MNNSDVPASSVAVEPADEDPLDRLNLSKGHTAVVGLQFGDEGKGQIVDLLSARFNLVVRYNGGANAGHSVYINSRKFSLHLIPSGIFYPDTINVVGNGVVIDPAQLLAEVDALSREGVVIGDNLRISDRAHLVLPYHKAEDALYDQALARRWQDQGQIPLGTTGRGIGPCYADKALRVTAVRMADALKTDRIGQQVQRIVAVKNVMLQSLATACGGPFEPLDADRISGQLVEQAGRLMPHVCDTTALLQERIAAGQQVLFEGANAAMLDIDHGTYPFVTSSQCSSLGISGGSGIPGGLLRHIIGIVKLYTSRVGGGPFPTELHEADSERIRHLGAEFGTTTGRPRRCGWLDLVATRYAARLCGTTALACTGISVLAGLDELKVCVGYRLRGRKLETFPSCASDLGAVEPIYEQFEPFDGPLDGCTLFDQLPSGARAYIEFIERFVGVPVAMVCVGRRRDQILAR